MERLRMSGQRHRALWHGSVIVAVLALGGCMMPSAHTTTRDFDFRPDLPVDPPGRGLALDGDAEAGGRLYKLYCGSCHNARPLGERPFAPYEVVVAHMRDQAYLTGVEYRQIIHFLRRWHDVGPPTRDVAPSPKRLVPPQPIAELRGAPPDGSVAPPPTGPGPFQPSEPANAPAAPQPPQGVPAPIE